MDGQIKFLDAKTRQWGFIVPTEEGNSDDVHFFVDNFVGPKPGDNDSGRAVQFDLEIIRGRREAKNIRIVGPPPAAAAPRAAHSQRTKPGGELKEWAFVPFIPFKHRNDIEYSSALELLAETALPERWHFGDSPNPKNPYPILDNYLTYTFYKLRTDGLVLERGDWATFNTGLVDKLFDAIFALFRKNERGEQPWKFFDFCIPGKRDSGRRLTSVFDPLPEPPKYFDSSFEMILDTSRDIHADYEHIIFDGVRRDRFPYAFLEHYVPKNFHWQRYTDLEFGERNDFLERLAETIADDVQCTRSIKRRLEDAKFLAEKRTRWNFKTAIPQYYPRFNTMSLLLPLAIVDDEVVDIALVVTKNPSGSYQGRTVLPLDWAYQNARLVCRPDSDWLVPNRIRHGEGMSDTDDSEEVGEGAR
jgi:hypothetical protein